MLILLFTIKEVLLHIALVEPIMRDLSPMPNGVDPDERTVFPFFRSTGNGMQFDVNKPLGLAAQCNLYLNAIRMAYPTGVRDGTPIVEIPFSKHSGRQGFIKHTVALLLAGLISTDTYLAICDHSTFAVNMLHNALDNVESAAARGMLGYPKQPPMPTMLQAIRNQHALIESFSVARAEHAQQTATVVHFTVAVVAAALWGNSRFSAEAATAAAASLEGLYGQIGDSSERMHGMTAALVGCGTGMSAIQQAAAFSTQLPFGAAAPIYVQSSQPALAQSLLGGATGEGQWGGQWGPSRSTM
ncbi:hypothetical protein T492DRAFT_1114516 [Pavlovales sp. CCMP2436]|nr:hypothetical protein T492DRAFT_1114516 [Pavlovales sp. CCMP2436]